jgi:GntR family transcriptional regulator
MFCVNTQPMKRPPLIQIELSSEVPAYEQIVSEIRALLVAGELRPGVQLPTVRQLAADLTAHRNTVAQAYRILSGEGWLDLRRGRGARVVLRPTPPRSGGTVQRMFRRQLKNLLAKAAAEGISPNDIARQLALHARDVRNWTPAKGGP